uniref:Tectonic-1-3 domain-containing protein n=1 Tax=Trichobilharzia regenti TaxID=157069 RepID=A0AA85JHQ3_TRIRE|nr:unnamed protein product [Trichobilharzia regenti]
MIILRNEIDFCGNATFDRSASDLLCIYSSNKKLIYVPRDIVRMDGDLQTFNNVYYMVDIPIQVSYGINEFTTLVIPQLAGTACSMIPARFGRPFISYCEWVIGNVESVSSSKASRISCNRLSDVFLSARNSKILSSMKFNDAENLTIVPNVSCYEQKSNQPIVCPTATPSDVIGNTTKIVCSNVPVSVYFKITYEVIGLITGVEIKAIFSDVMETFVQKYEVEFVQVNSSNSVPLSGNPGYLIGRPIVSAKVNRTELTSLGYSGNTGTVTTMIPTTDVKLSNEGVKQTLNNGVWNILAGGQCGTLIQDKGVLIEPIRFGEDVFSGCTLNLPSFEKLTRPEMDWTTRCIQYQSLIWKTVLSPLGIASGQNSKGLGINFIPEKPDSIAIWPISKGNRSSEWIPIQNLISDNFPSTPRGLNGYCYQLLVGQEIEIQYSRYGSMKLPQNQIVGAKSNYIYGDIFLMKPNVNIEITQRVRFVDVTPVAEIREKLLPYFLLRLPSDFFYPFV